MTNPDLEKIIKDFSKYYGINIKQLEFSFDNKIPDAQVNGKSELIRGLRNLVCLVFSPENPDDNVIQDQWVEFALTHVGRMDVSTSLLILKDLNDYIINKVYFVGNQLGPVDILIYYVLHSVMTNLTFQEKEKYLHISRWFNNIQHNEKARLGRSIVPFSRSCLYL